MALEGDAHQLAARAHAGLMKELLEDSFYRGFRTVDATGNLFVGESVEDAAQNLMLAAGQCLAAETLGPRVALGDQGSDGEGI